MLNEYLISRNKLVNGITIPPIMLGSFQINDAQIMREMVESALKSGCLGFDTSPSYGSEEILGKAIHDISNKLEVPREKLFISNKIDGWQMFECNGEVEGFVDCSLAKMKIEYFDLLLIHWPFEKYLLDTWRCFERMYKSGKVKSIGLCNVNIRILENLFSKGLEIKPHVIQNEISPLRTCLEEVQYYQNNGIVIEAYSPLCRMINPIKESTELKIIANKYDKTIAQVILRWNLERGVIPIFTSSKPERIMSNLDIFNFTLTDNDIETINRMNQNYKIFPESYGCPGIDRGT